MRALRKEHPRHPRQELDRIGNWDIANQLKIDTQVASAIVKGLVSEGRLSKSGHGPGMKYHPIGPKRSSRRPADQAPWHRCDAPRANGFRMEDARILRAPDLTNFDWCALGGGRG